MPCDRQYGRSMDKMTAEEKLERFCYTGDDRNIRARYIDGNC